MSIARPGHALSLLLLTAFGGRTAAAPTPAPGPAPPAAEAAPTYAAAPGASAPPETPVGAAPALALDGLFAAWRCVGAGLAIGALSTDAAMGSGAPFRAAVHELRGHRGQIEGAACPSALLEPPGTPAIPPEGDRRSRQGARPGHPVQPHLGAQARSQHEQGHGRIGRGCHERLRLADPHVAPREQRNPHGPRRGHLDGHHERQLPQ